MKCNSCGNEIAEGTAFCPNCGAKVEYSSEPQNEQPQSNSFDFSEQLNKLNDTPDSTASFDSADIEANKVLALLSYLGILFLVPLIAAKDSKFARFHANQGLVMFIFELILGVVSSIPVIGLIVGAVGYLVTVVFIILGIVNAAGGKAKELPLIGKFKLLK